MNTIFEISKNPKAQGYDRKIHLIGPFIDFSKKEISCHATLKHYENGEVSENYINSRHINMFTSNEKYVDVQGNRVEPDENGVYPEGSIPEFEFLYNFGKEQYGVSVGDMMLQLIGFMIQRNDQDGNFNDLTVFPS
ncbi:MAG: hypothetical protein ACOVQ4_13975 [Flectobacillus sp.]|uniref:hypothetical protein n=1 Tax=Flectobacillus sp. TaxID=50419 RepID=UPI003B994DFC